MSYLEAVIIFDKTDCDLVTESLNNLKLTNVKCAAYIAISQKYSSNDSRETNKTPDHSFVNEVFKWYNQDNFTPEKAIKFSLKGELDMKKVELVVLVEFNQNGEMSVITLPLKYF